MLTKRLIACFDIKNGLVTKAQQFQDNIPVGAPAPLAAKLYHDGIDEVVFYDITASSDRRGIDLDTVRGVADVLFVPFTVGGGIRTVETMYDVLDAGAEKISIDSAAVRNPALLTEGAAAFGRQCMVLSMQTKSVGKSAKFPSGYEIYIDGARSATGLDAVAWAREGEARGAGEICVNSIDNDGILGGYDLDITAQIAEATSIPLIASGGAGAVDHLRDVFALPGVGGGIISSMLYSPRLPRNFSVAEIKSALIADGICVR